MMWLPSPHFTWKRCALRAYVAWWQTYGPNAGVRSARSGSTLEDVKVIKDEYQTVQVGVEYLAELYEEIESLRVEVAKKEKLIGKLKRELMLRIT